MREESEEKTMINHLIPEGLKDQFFVNAWSFFNVPMLFGLDLNSLR